MLNVYYDFFKTETILKGHVSSAAKGKEPEESGEAQGKRYCKAVECDKCERWTEATLKVP